jgi:hypothetical protein
MVVNGTVSAKSIIERLIPAYQFTGVESGYTIRFVFKSDAFVAARVSQAFLGASASNEPDTKMIPITRHDFLETPTQVTVRAPARHRSYNSDSQSHKINTNLDNGVNIVELDFPFVLDRYQMKDIAQNTLYELLSQRQSYQFFLPPRFFLLEPFDVVEVESTLEDDPFHVLRITSHTLGNNLDAEMSGADYKRFVYAGYRSVPSISKSSVIIIPQPPFIGADFYEPPYLILFDVFVDSPRRIIAPYAKQGSWTDGNGRSRSHLLSDSNAHSTRGVRHYHYAERQTRH